MGLIELFLLIIIAGVCGAVAQRVVGYSHGGCLVSIVVGFIGSLLGTWMARELDWPMPLPLRIGDHTFPILWAIIGAVIFVAVVGLFRGGPKRK